MPTAAMRYALPIVSQRTTANLPGRPMAARSPLPRVAVAERNEAVERNRLLRRTAAIQNGRLQAPLVGPATLAQVSGAVRGGVGERSADAVVLPVEEIVERQAHRQRHCQRPAPAESQ